MLASLLPLLITLAEWLFKKALIRQEQLETFMRWCKHTLEARGHEAALSDDIQRQLDDLAQMELTLDKKK